MAVKIPDQLKEVADQVSQGNQRSDSVRTVLSWFGAARRGKWTVVEVRKALRKLKLYTEPDFEDVWIDAVVAFRPKPIKQKGKDADSGAKVQDPDQPELETASAPVPKKAGDDVSTRIRISRLDAANKPPVCISPDAKISEAITLMLQHDYSQLPVTTTTRDVKGLMSWKSLGSRLALGKQCSKVRECMEEAAEVRADDSLFDAIQMIVAHDCVLVRDSTHALAGIVTTADLSLQFKDLGEPFLLLGQIEDYVRNLIANKYHKAELIQACDPADLGREIEDVADLTLGEYIRLLENPARWDKLGVPIDRKTFLSELERVRGIRNDVMHFDPDPVGPEDLAVLRKFVRFLGGLEEKMS
jgi:predicted transcriptional regulator